MRAGGSYHEESIKQNGGEKMDQPHKDFVLQVIDGATDLTLATVREDGFPQATTVSFAHDGLDLYVGIGKDSQKARNIRKNNKVSLTVNLPYTDWREIKGVSMSALADLIEDKAGMEAAGAILLKRFPQMAELAHTEMAQNMAILRIRPQLVSVLDYTKGFGHTELVSV